MVTKIGLYRDPRKKKPLFIRWYGEYDPIHKRPTSPKDLVVD